MLFAQLLKEVLSKYNKELSDSVKCDEVLVCVIINF
jgi:hypothetical protein